MRKIMQLQGGFTLIELMLGLTLSVVLLSAMAPLLSTNIQSWIVGNSRMEVQQTARFAVDSMVRELRYGQNFQLENPYSITFEVVDNVSPNIIYKYRYSLDTGDHKLYRVPISPSGSKQPVTGSTSPKGVKIVINQANETLFEVPDANTVRIVLVATDTYSGRSTTIRTAVYSISQYLK